VTASQGWQWWGNPAELRDVLSTMQGFFDGEEDVDELDHALQCATHAIRSGAGRELTAAAFLHDVGRAPAVEPGYPSTPHEQAGALWLQPRASDKVAWLVEAHVPAKVFLVGSDPAYVDALSPASVSSLAYQSRGVDEAELAPWAAHPWWPEALQLRRWDDAAKVPGAATATVDEVFSELGIV
jgi:predicted HD phosphohydrolase